MGVGFFMAGQPKTKQHLFIQGRREGITAVGGLHPPQRK